MWAPAISAVAAVSEPALAATFSFLQPRKFRKWNLTKTQKGEEKSLTSQTCRIFLRFFPLLTFLFCSFFFDFEAPQMCCQNAKKRLRFCRGSLPEIKSIPTIQISSCCGNPTPAGGRLHHRAKKVNIKLDTKQKETNKRAGPLGVGWSPDRTAEPSGRIH